MKELDIWWFATTFLTLSGLLSSYTPAIVAGVAAACILVCVEATMWFRRKG